MSHFTLDDVRDRTYKARDAWWTVLLVDPLAARLVRVTANRTGITPNQLTVASLVLGLGAAVSFAAASWPLLLLGALLYHLSFTLDCMDGKIARLKGTGSVFGAWLDYIFDRVRVLACAVALMGGQYAVTGNVAYVWAAIGVVFLDMLRYMDALEIYKVRTQMRARLGKLQEEAAPDDDLEEQVVGDQRATAELLQQGFHQKFPWYLRIRNALTRGRIRSHLISGIEFQMGVFIVAPVIAAAVPGAIIPVAALVGVGLMAFELFIIYKFWLSSRDYQRTLARLEGEVADMRAGAPQARRHSLTADRV